MSTMMEQDLMLVLCIGVAIIMFNKFLRERSK